ncbi:acetyl-CoA acetyltransferase [Bosea sp. 2KB_26]|uniref:acetyl-CoA acetyltransferase n=1 Tax=Bosea sp. 2KB_26 TaxID=3237475 RepID=UPI003F932503
MTTRPVYIAGAAETPLGEVHDHNELSMIALAAAEALAEAGLSIRDVDGLFVNYMGEEGSVQVGEYLGIQPRYADSTDFGGAAFEAHVHKAIAAINAGFCEVALITYASRQRSRRARLREPAAGGMGVPMLQQLEVPTGLPAPIGRYALYAARHMHLFGTTREQMAEVAVASRMWAMRNPKAWSRKPLSIDQVLSSAPICDPLTRLDCCLVTDGGGAIVVTTAERARDAAKKAVRVIGAAQSQNHWLVSQMPDLDREGMPGRRCGPEAFAMAGIRPADVDVFQPYDSFTISVLIALEDLGFCKPGEGGAFAQSGALRPGGALPSMTSGGGLSYNHPGALGLMLLIEAVRQLRGEAGERQVPDARIGVAHGTGGFLSTASTVVLAHD